jgi:fatty acid desaturase
MKELNNFGWYAKRISPYLPKYVFKPVPSRLLGGLIYLVVITGGFLLISLLDLNLWATLIISCILGFSFAAMGFLGHEILHGTVVRNPWLRNLLGAIAFWPLSTGPRLWIKWHNMNHHAHTQNEELDPDAWMSLEQFSGKRLIKWIYRLPLSFRALLAFVSLAFTFSMHSTSMFIRYIKDFGARQKLTVCLQLILPWSTWIGLLFILGMDKWFFSYLLPLFIGNFIVMAYISTNHRLNPLVSINDPLANSLSVTVPRWVDVLHFNFSYHTEHHLFPAVNPKYYPLVKQYIKKMWPESYHEMPLITALQMLWKTPRIYYRKEKLIDPYENRIYGTLGNGLNPSDISNRKIIE